MARLIQVNPSASAALIRVTSDARFGAKLLRTGLLDNWSE
jgi:hypothetical protein